MISTVQLAAFGMVTVSAVAAIALPSERMRPVAFWGWTAVLNGAAAAAGWLWAGCMTLTAGPVLALIAIFCSANFTRLAVTAYRRWKRHRDDDEDRGHRPRVGARTRIPRPRIVQIRPLGSPA